MDSRIRYISDKQFIVDCINKVNKQSSFEIVFEQIDKQIAYSKKEIIQAINK